jgi:hypothetical protein
MKLSVAIGRYAGLALLAATLSDCASQEEVAVQPMTAEQRQASADAREKWKKDQAAAVAKAAAAREAEDDSKCRSYGAKPGTKPYIDCRVSLNQLRDQQAARAQAAAQAEAAAEEAREQQDLQDRRALALQYLMSRPQPQPYVPNPTINCRSNQVGNQTYTNCN